MELPPGTGLWEKEPGKRTFQRISTDRGRSRGRLGHGGGVFTHCPPHGKRWPTATHQAELRQEALSPCPTQPGPLRPSHACQVAARKHAECQGKGHTSACQTGHPSPSPAPPGALWSPIKGKQDTGHSESTCVRRRPKRNPCGPRAEPGATCHAKSILS